MSVPFIPQTDKDFLIDCAVVSFASDLIGLAQKVENKDVDLTDVIVCGADHDNDKKINWKMQKLQNRLKKTFDKLRAFHKEQLAYHIKLIQNAELYGSESIQPDYFAVWLLRFRFCSTKWANKRQLDKRFQWIAEYGDELLSIIDLLDETVVANRDDDMADLSHKIIKNI